MDNYTTKRLNEVKTYLASQKISKCNAPIVEIISNIERLRQYLLDEKLVPYNWVDDRNLLEFEIISINDDGAFVKRGYKKTQFYIASWEEMNPTFSIYLNQILNSETHYVDQLLLNDKFKQLKSKLSNVVLLELIGY